MQNKINIIFVSLFFSLTIAVSSSAEDLPSTDELLNTLVDRVEVHETPIEDLLRLLAAQINLNLIIGPDSMGTVSLRFSNVTMREALDAILEAKGYQYQLYGNIMMVSEPDSLERIKGLGLKTQLFTLKYLDARDIKATIDTSRILSPWGYASIHYKSVSTNALKASNIKPAIDNSNREEFDLTEPVSAEKTPLLARSNELIITDKPPNLLRVKKLIALLDLPYRQVEIEVHFIETLLTDDKQLGIDWSKILKVEGSYQGRTSWELGDVLGLSDNTPSQDGSGSDRGNVLDLGSLAQTRFKAILEMMIQNKTAKLLSQPRITTIDNQPATISVGITTWIEELTSGGVSGDVQITYTERQVPIELIVVPHIMHDDRIMLELRPRIEEITGWQEGIDGLQLPLISTRTADSRVEVANNETAVIGGLIKEKSITINKKVWLLGSIPLLGYLFRYEEEKIEKTDLTIFITPRIIEHGEPLKSSPKAIQDGETGENRIDRLKENGLQGGKVTKSHSLKVAKSRSCKVTTFLGQCDFATMRQSELQ